MQATPTLTPPPDFFAALAARDVTAAAKAATPPLRHTPPGLTDETIIQYVMAARRARPRGIRLEDGIAADARVVLGLAAGSYDMCSPLPSEDPAERQHRNVHGFDISRDPSNGQRSIGLHFDCDGRWLEPNEALQIAFLLQRYANQTILHRAVQAIEPPHHPV